LFKRIIGSVTGKKTAPKQAAGRPSPAPAQKNPAPKSQAAGKPAKHKTARGGQKKRSHDKRPADVVEQASWSLKDFHVEAVPDKTRFHDLDLPEPVMHAIHDLGFQYCTPIQAESLPAALRGRDTIGQAQTGTGKSAAFLLTILNRLLTIKPKERYASEPRALIIAPTRELAMQIGKDAEGLARHSGLTVVTVVGGMHYEEQRKQLRDGVVDILVATPGRLIDFMRSQDVYLDQVEVLVLDEADRMLDMGFIPDVRRIVRSTPPKHIRQTLLFSATFNFDVRILIDQWTTDPIKVEIEPEQVATDRVDQKFLLVQESDKFGILEQFLAEQKPERCIIFANRRDLTRTLCERLNKKNHKAVLLSGEVNQQKRIKTLERFREGQVNLMVATDVAGRGIHVDGVSHVINYTLPDDSEDYVHRIGRTGRAGAKGVSLSLISENDAFAVPDLEKYLGTKLKLEQP